MLVSSQVGIIDQILPDEIVKLCLLTKAFQSVIDYGKCH